MDNSSSNWMQSSGIKTGAFTAKANAHHLNVSSYAKDVMSGKSNANTKTKREASLAETFEKLAGHGKRHTGNKPVWSPTMSKAQDDTYDKANKIKEGSKKDKELDARLDVNKGKM